MVTALGIPSESLADSAWATGAAVEILVGKGIFYFLAIAMFGAVVSGLNGFFISSSRLIDTMSDDYNVGKRQGAVKTGNGTIPRWVIYVIGACALIVPFFGRTALLWFVDLSSIGASVAYFMTCLCAYKIAENGKDKIVSSLGMLVSLAFLVFLLTPIFDSNISLPSYFSLAFWVALGFVVFFYIRNRKQLI